MNALYGVLRECVSYFQPSVRLVAKERVGSRVRKTYDAAQTPCRRVLATPDVAGTGQGTAPVCLRTPASRRGAGHRGASG